MLVVITVVRFEPSAIPKIEVSSPAREVGVAIKDHREVHRVHCNSKTALFR